MAASLARAFRLLVVAVTWGVFFCPRSAHAWIETAVEAHRVRISADGSEKAEVRHELVIRLRGGPLETLDVAGLGEGLEVLPDAKVESSRAGSVASWPLSISAGEGGSLRLRVQSERGLRGGSYVFAFSYRTLLGRKVSLVDGADGVRLTWVGPRLANGVDGARVTFAIPRAEHAPELVAPDGGGAVPLLAEVRRGADIDEIELVRTHVASGEPAVWQVLVDPGAVGKLATEGVRAAPIPLARRALSGAGLATAHLLVALGFALLYACLASLRARLSSEAARREGARSRPLVPAAPIVRGLGVFVLLGGGGLFSLLHRPLVTVISLALGALFMVHLLPERRLVPRGPGVWERQTGVLDVRGPELPGDVFEIGRPLGFLLFLVLTLAPLALAWHLLPRDDTLALLSVAWMVLPLPLFWTGRHGDLPGRPVVQAAAFYEHLRTRLTRAHFELEVWARKSNAASAEGAQVDEVRLRVVGSRFPRGLVAFEVGFEEGRGAYVAPCVVLRVVEDSPADRCLPHEFVRQRGRAVDERVVLLWPSGPSRKDLLRLVSSLAVLLERGSGERCPPESRSLERSRRAGAQSDPKNASRRSSGKGVQAENSAPSAPIPVI